MGIATCMHMHRFFDVLDHWRLSGNKQLHYAECYLSTPIQDFTNNLNCGISGITDVTAHFRKLPVARLTEFSAKRDGAVLQQK